MRQIAFPLAAFAGVVLWSGLVVSGGGHVRQIGEGAETSLSGDDLAAMTAESAEAEAVLAQGETSQAAGADMPAVPAQDESGAREKPGAGAPASPQLEQNAARTVEPDAFAYPVAKGNEPLERVAPKEPPPPPPRDPIVLTRPGTVKAGVIAIWNRSLYLTGVTPTELGRTCTDKAGREWPCGVAARTAMRLFLRNRAIACDLPGKDWPSGSTAACKLGDTDLGEWLVSNGWAEAAPGSVLKPLEDEARKAGKGFYGEDPRQKSARGAKP